MATNEKHNLIGYDPLAWMDEPDIAALTEIGEAANAVETDDLAELELSETIEESDFQTESRIADLAVDETFDQPDLTEEADVYDDSEPLATQENEEFDEALDVSDLAEEQSELPESIEEEAMFEDSENVSDTRRRNSPRRLKPSRR